MVPSPARPQALCFLLSHPPRHGTLPPIHGPLAPAHSPLATLCPPSSFQAFAEAADSLVPTWNQLASRAAWPPWVVVTGITPLLGPAALSAWRTLIHTAHAQGGRVSLDLNHRPALGGFDALWSLVAPMLPCVSILVLSEGNVHTLAKMVLQDQPDARDSARKGEPGGEHVAGDAADGSGRFESVLRRLRGALSVPMLACSIKRPINPHDHAAAAAAPGAAPAAAPSTDRRLPTRRWSMVATPLNVVSSRELPTEHTPLEPLGGGDAWLAGFLSALLPVPGCGGAAAAPGAALGAGPGAALATPATPTAPAPLPALLQPALRRGDLLAALQQSTHGDTSCVTRIELDVAEVRWRERTAEVCVNGVGSQHSAAAPPQPPQSGASVIAAPGASTESNQLPNRDQLSLWTQPRIRDQPPDRDQPSNWEQLPAWKELHLRLRQSRLLPIISVDRPSDAVPLARALAAGGARVVEVVLRTPAAAEALGQIVEQVPELMLGAGTVLTIEQARSVAHGPPAQPPLQGHKNKTHPRPLSRRAACIRAIGCDPTPGDDTPSSPVLPPSPHPSPTPYRPRTRSAVAPPSSSRQG